MRALREGSGKGPQPPEWRVTARHSERGRERPRAVTDRTGASAPSVRFRLKSTESEGWRQSGAVTLSSRPVEEAKN